LDSAQIREDIKANKMEVDLKPVLDAAQQIKTQLDLAKAPAQTQTSSDEVTKTGDGAVVVKDVSDVISEVRKMKTEIDFSQVLEAINSVTPAMNGKFEMTHALLRDEFKEVRDAETAAEQEVGKIRTFMDFQSRALHAMISGKEASFATLHAAIQKVADQVSSGDRGTSSGTSATVSADLDQVLQAVHDIALTINGKWDELRKRRGAEAEALQDLRAEVLEKLDAIPEFSETTGSTEVKADRGKGGQELSKKLDEVQGELKTLMVTLITNRQPSVDINREVQKIIAAIQDIKAEDYSQDFVKIHDNFEEVKGQLEFVLNKD
jgi:hypothetical protein